MIKEMKTIRNSSPAEATLEWLKAELNSDRFRSGLDTALLKLSSDEKIITDADLTNENENQTRWNILKSYRDWLDKDFEDYEWELVELDQADVSELRYIDYSYWNELSDGTQKVGVAAANVTDGKVVFDVPNDKFFSVAEAVDNGLGFGPIIVVLSSDKQEGELLEGHLRATGYVMAKQRSKPLRAIRGTPRQ